MVEHVIGNDGVVSPILISGTNARNPPLWRVFALVIGGRSGLTRDCEAIGKSGIDIAERILRGGGDVVRHCKRRRTFLSAAPFLKTVPRGAVFALSGLAHIKSDSYFPENSNSAKIIGLFIFYVIP